jgi:vacuolar-type H+-ATPase subunit C/Vma6
MQITLDIPDELAAQMISGGTDIPRAALEALAVEGYRTERLSESEIRHLLGFETRMEVHAFLKEHSAWLHYSVADLERDRASALRLRARRQPPIASHERLAG